MAKENKPLRERIKYVLNTHTDLHTEVFEGTSVQFADLNCDNAVVSILNLLKEELEGLTVIAQNILEVAWHGDYSSGNEAFGIDEGRVKAFERLKDLEAQLSHTIKEIKDRLG